MSLIFQISELVQFRLLKNGLNELLKIKNGHKAKEKAEKQKQKLEIKRFNSQMEKVKKMQKTQTNSLALNLKYNIKT